jgi:AbrB family looped-hinge helix DNA binding protein
MQPMAKPTKKMKIFPKGQVIIPADLRRRYNIDIGDQIEFVTCEEGILLRPSKEKSGRGSLVDKLYGMLHSYSEGKKFPDKKSIRKATEDGLVDGWAE